MGKIILEIRNIPCLDIYSQAFKIADIAYAGIAGQDRHPCFGVVHRQLGSPFRDIFVDHQPSESPRLFHRGCILNGSSVTLFNPLDDREEDKVSPTRKASDCINTAVGNNWPKTSRRWLQELGCPVREAQDSITRDRSGSRK
jgi:hypothetical protein